MKHLIIYGSSSGTSGKTWDLIQFLQGKLNAEIINLSDYDFSFFDYDHKNKDDDFKTIALKMLSADCILFATPLYWYAMSAQLKTFFDRLNDLTTLRRPWGRQLKGKSTAFIATGNQEELPLGFEIPFKGTADFFEMEFKGYIYICTATQLFKIEHAYGKIETFIATIEPKKIHPLT